MTDELRDRLRRADPAATVGDDPSTIRAATEAAMTDTRTLPESTTPGEPRSPRRLPSRGVLLAAAATLAAVGTVAALGLGGDDAPPAAAPTVLELTLPPSDATASCIAYDVTILADMPLALSGTATSVQGDEVRLDVDRWYRGGDADEVRLLNPTGPMTSIDGIELVEGERYLLTASEDGTVNGCGFSAPWTAEQAADFETAFGS